MPTDYEALVAALKLTDVPFAEYGWSTRPEGTYGVVALEFENTSDDGDNLKQDRSWEGSIDLFSKSKRGEGHPAEIEEILTEICEDAWELNSTTWEPETKLFHWEWVFRVEE